MIVSILQLMGLAFGKSIQSRPGPDSQSGPDNKPSKIDNKGINRRNADRVLPDQIQPVSASPKKALASSSRRQEVKAQTAKPTAQAKAQAPIVSPRTGAQPAGKAAEKSAAKKTEPATKAAVKPVTTKAVKTAPTPSAAVKPVSAKPAAKPKAVATETMQAVPAKRAASSEPVAATPGKAVPPVVAVPAAPAVKPVSPAPQPAKAGRPSRLSQITVPSMAQAVASTAAKASYTNTMSTPVLTHPSFTPVKKDPKLANNWKNKSADQLTDAEVLAMSDDEYMNDKQMAFFRLKLSLLKQEILSNAGETTEHLRADTVVVPDPADRATIEEEHALELRTRDRERKLLKKIEQSITRIDAGDYGYCDETGEPIGVGRLLARPTATLSLEAQQRRELKQKMFGD